MFYVLLAVGGRTHIYSQLIDYRHSVEIRGGFNKKYLTQNVKPCKTSQSLTRIKHFIQRVMIILMEILTAWDGQIKFVFEPRNKESRGILNADMDWTKLNSVLVGI